MGGADMKEIKCTICGSTFIAKRSDAKYCSEKCRTRSETIARTEKNRRERIINPKNCKVCGCEFVPNVMTPYQIYCSSKCLSTAMNKRAVDTGRKKEYYQKTKGKYYSKKREIDNKYKDLIRFSGNKEKVLERDEYKCVCCGLGDQLIIHHKDHSGSNETPNNDIENLETLCRSCHAKHHELGVSVRG